MALVFTCSKDSASTNSIEQIHDPALTRRKETCPLLSTLQLLVTLQTLPFLPQTWKGSLKKDRFTMTKITQTSKAPHAPASLSGTGRQDLRHINRPPEQPPYQHSSSSPIPEQDGQGSARIAARDIQEHAMMWKVPESD